MQLDSMAKYHLSIPIGPIQGTFNYDAFYKAVNSCLKTTFTVDFIYPTEIVRSNVETFIIAKRILGFSVKHLCCTKYTNLVGPIGFESTTHGLKVRCSTGRATGSNIAKYTHEKP